MSLVYFCMFCDLYGIYAHICGEYAKLVEAVVIREARRTVQCKISGANLVSYSQEMAVLSSGMFHSTYAIVSVQLSCDFFAPLHHSGVMPVNVTRMICSW